MNDQPSPSTSTPPPFSSTSHLFPPPLREILDAFAQNGGGDRELLLAILAAKTAEEDVSLIQDFSLSPSSSLSLEEPISS